MANETCRANLCCIVVPVYQWPISNSEMFALKNNVLCLSNRDIILIGPREIVNQTPDSFCNKKIKKLEFPKKYFLSVSSYNRLMTSRFFYNEFTKYTHILIAQLDSLVFEDRLDFWCAQGYSYIGAPWFNGFSKPRKPYKLIGCGNGGLSLRSVDDAVSFLSKFRYVGNKLNTSTRSAGLVSSTYRIVRDDLVFAYNIRPFFPRVAEDIFWGCIVPKAASFFRVPTPEIALNFSFDANPRVMFELNSGNLPFGCHAWEKYDIDFWLDTLSCQFFTRFKDEESRIDELQH